MVNYQKDRQKNHSLKSKINLSLLSTFSSEQINDLNLSKAELLNLLSETITEKNKLEAILQNIDNGVFAVDWDGKIMLFNQAAQKITGLKQKDVIGRYCEEVLNLIDEKGKKTSADLPLAEALAEDKTINIPFCYLQAKRRKIPASVSYNSIKGIKNDLVLGICVFKDLSKEKELDRMKSDFVTMAAHELRTPLTSIRGYLSILNEELTNIDPEYQEFIRRALVSSTRLDTLVKNILSVSKIERGTITLNFREFVPQEIVDFVVDDLKNKAAEKKISISVEIDKNISRLFADKEKIQEVLTNLVDNAISYTPENGKVSVTVKKIEKIVEFRISDSGIGISKEGKKRLFKKFSRVFNKAKVAEKGTGLGLYISKLIIQMHKGKIGVISKGLNKGSSFYFQLPISSSKK